jgi:hypothetical protein
MPKLPRPRHDHVDPNPWSVAENLDLRFDAMNAAFARVLNLLPPDGSLLPAAEFYARAAAVRPPIPQRTAEYRLRQAEREGLAERTQGPGDRGHALYRRIPRGEFMARWTVEYYRFGLSDEGLRELVDVSPLDPTPEATAGRLAGRLITDLWLDETMELRAMKGALRTKAEQGEEAAGREWSAWIQERNRRADGRFSDLFGRNLLAGVDSLGIPVGTDVALRAVTIALNVVETIRRAGPRTVPFARHTPTEGSAPIPPRPMPGRGMPGDDA